MLNGECLALNVELTRERDSGAIQHSTFPIQHSPFALIAPGAKRRQKNARFPGRRKRVSAL